MDGITLGQIAAASAFLVALIASITALMKQMKKWILNTVKSEVDRLDGKIDANTAMLDKMQKSRERSHADTARRNILNFNDELLRGEKHSKEAFDQTLRDIDEYEHYSNTHPDYPNNQAIMAIEHTKQRYKHCVDTSSFLR